jgi:hypothetical protein
METVQECSSLDLCSVSLVLAALFQHIEKCACDDVEGNVKSDFYLRNARKFLVDQGYSAQGYDFDPELGYEAACLEVLSGYPDRACKLLPAVLEIQPGCLTRIENDFRFERLTNGDWESRWEEIKEEVVKTRSET